MKIYVDLVFFINFCYDFFLLMAVSFFLKQSTPLKKILKGALFGGLSIIFLFLPLKEWHLFLFKILVSIFMILISFSYSNKQLFLKQLGTLYLASFLLGGILYSLKDTIGYEQKGLLFLHHEPSFHLLFVIILGPVFFYFYWRNLRKNQSNLSLVHSLCFELLGKNYQIEGFLDTGNQLKDPYKKRSVILLYEKDFIPNIEDAILVPYETAKGKGIVRCLVPDNLTVDGKNLKNYLIGFLQEKIEIEGRSCILPNKMREELK